MYKVDNDMGNLYIQSARYIHSVFKTNLVKYSLLFAYLELLVMEFGHVLNFGKALEQL